jgi:hypothetical protein
MAYNYKKICQPISCTVVPPKDGHTTRTATRSHNTRAPPAHQDWSSRRHKQAPPRDRRRWRLGPRHLIAIGDRWRFISLRASLISLGILYIIYFELVSDGFKVP